MSPRNGSLDGEVKANQPHRKQVRRRLHTSRPYQEKLLDMAEARREIATALKHHRAAMRQANEQKEKILKQQEQQRMVSENRCLYPPNEPPVPQTLFDALNVPLPDQPLGLNLNLQDFERLETASPNIVYSSSSPSSSVPTQETPLLGKCASESSSLHQAVDDDDMAEMRSFGDGHGMEWNDAMNFVNPSRWLKFSKAVDEEVHNERAFDPFNDIMGFPDCFYPTENNITCSSKDSFHFHDLPKMDIGDIDGLDGDWLS